MLLILEAPAVRGSDKSLLPLQPMTSMGKSMAANPRYILTTTSHAQGQQHKAQKQMRAMTRGKRIHETIEPMIFEAERRSQVLGT